MTPHVTRAVAEGAASTRTMPSREFLVRQAVLNRMQTQMPSFVVKMNGADFALRWCVSGFGDHIPRYFVEEVRAEFRILVDRFEATQIISEIPTVGSSRL